MGFTEWDLPGESAASVSTTEVGDAGAARAVRYGRKYWEAQRAEMQRCLSTVCLHGVNGGFLERFEGGLRRGEVFILTSYNGGSLTWDQVVAAAESEADSA